MCNLDKIVDRCKKGDRKAGEQLYHMFSAKMFALCIQYSKSREEAEDNLQDGFIKVLESIDQYKGKGSFETYFHQHGVREIQKKSIRASCRRSSGSGG